MKGHHSGGDMTHYRAHVARKWHTCAECHRQIKPQTRYLYGFAVLDGIRTWAHFCEDCCTGDFHRDGSLGRAWDAAQKRVSA